MFKENISLKQYNTFGIEASARYFAEANTTQEMQEILSARDLSIPLMILGGGSNLLFTENFNGLVIRNNIKGIKLDKEDDENYYVTSGAGENWHEFVMYCINHHYAGLENLSLIPGSVGAGPMQNIGAYGVEVKDVFYSLEALNIHSNKVEIFDLKACEFGYRESVFKRKLKGQYIILNVTYRLKKNPVFHTQYGAITQELEKMGVKELSIKAISQAVIHIRSSKLPDPFKIGNAGSFFKNPVVSEQRFEELKNISPNIIGHPNPGGGVKLFAGWLIEQCGWKGKTFGDAGVHKDQALVLVNYGKATGKEILDLSQKIMDSVKEKFAVELEREVNII